MKANNSQGYTGEIENHLLLAREKIEEVIYLVDSNESWKVIHAQTEETISHLKQSVRLLARHHLEHCMPKKQARDGRFLNGHLDEIIKTFGYIS